MLLIFNVALTFLFQKRLTLAGDLDSLPSPSTPQNTFRGSASGSTSRFSSEDWVKQADSLTIDGPSLSNVVSGIALETNANERYQMDDSMVCVHLKAPSCVYWTGFGCPDNGL